MYYVRRSLLLALAVPLLIAGCPFAPPGDSPNPFDTGDARLQRFTSADELLSFFKNQASRTISTNARNSFFYGFFGQAEATNDLATPAAAGGDSAPTDNSASDGGGSFTTTNIQEIGVDESDVVKTDGANFYMVRGKTLHIVKATPIEEMAEIAMLELDDRIESIYLKGDRLYALSQTYGAADDYALAADIAIWPPYYRSSAAKVYEIDIADPTKPEVVETVEIDGSLVTSRLVNERLLLVLAITPTLPTTQSGIDGLTLEDILPKARMSGGDEAIAIDWPDWFRPGHPDGYYMTAVMSLDLADITKVEQSVAVMASAGTIYASPDALYLTDTAYDENDNYRETTTIHKFAFDDNGVADYEATGSVPGRLLNQFSLGEFEGVLRVATSIQPSFFFGDDVVLIGNGTVGVGVDVAEPVPVDARAQSTNTTEPTNAIFTLGADGDELKTLGSIMDIAPGEQIYSARFLGTRGFLVTFKQIDPLFTVDLADPENPKLVGELKIPGFSEYLHPLGENYLIGVGQATETAPWGGTIMSGIQLSLFDISDFANPKALDQITIGGRGSYTDVSYTHKAFTLLQPEGEDPLLAIPAQILPETDFDSFSYEPVFDGVLLYRLADMQSFEEVRAIAGVTQGPFGYGWTEWRRAAINGDYLYALTDDGVRAVDYVDPDAEAVKVEFAVEEDPYFDIYQIEEDFGVSPGDDEGGGSSSPSVGAVDAPPAE
ncbi:MAG: beta-propeller domain-containing protein [Phycisphaerales bacterium]|nr:beta-propeller domain-containing protein [Phycisphaerales bacterium]